MRSARSTLLRMNDRIDPKRYLRAWVNALALLWWTASAGADPTGAYGLTAGMDLEQVQQVAGELQQLNPFTYIAGSLPGSHPDLETFALVITPEEGLCRLQATSAAIADAGDGTVVREKFDRLFEMLWGAHGKHQVVSTLLADSSHQAPHEWMTALLEKERVLMTLWTLDDGSELSGGLDRVVLSARALKPTEGFLNIDYTFFNWPGCQARLESQALAAGA